MQDNSNSQQKFLIDAEIGDDDVTLPSLPSVDVPIIETPRVEQAVQAKQAQIQETVIQEAVTHNTAQQKTENNTAISTVSVTKAKRTETTAPEESGGFFSRMKQGLSKSRKNLADGMVNILIGGKEIDDELLEEVEDQLLVADIGVDATKTIIQNLTERTARGDLIYSHSLYKALQEELVNILAPRVKPLHIDSNKSPYVILVVGVNGVGKTTTIGKLAKRLFKISPNVQHVAI